MKCYFVIVLPGIPKVFKIPKSMSKEIQKKTRKREYCIEKDFSIHDSKANKKILVHI